MNQEAFLQYNTALKAGQKYYKSALANNTDPYPVVLDSILTRENISGQKDIGLINIPVSLIAGVKSEGRTNALAGNFMPLLDNESEFAFKWIHLCDAHLSSEGIRDPIKCYEYLGKFYVEEGNKRASVLMSYGASSIPANVTRLLPVHSSAPEVLAYYEFLSFYNVAKIYELQFTKPGSYLRLLKNLGLSPDHIWTEEERRRFLATLSKFGEAFAKLHELSPELTRSEAFLTWTDIYPVSLIRDITVPEIVKKLEAIRSDLAADVTDSVIMVSTEPASTDKSLKTKLFGSGVASVRVAFIYAFPKETSAWTRGHEHGRKYLEEKLTDKVKTSVFEAYDHHYYEVMEKAAIGHDIIIATTPNMIDASRRIAAEFPQVKVMNCALSVPYPGVRMFYGRIHECKFITGAMAGAMADHNTIGYIASYPIYGSIAGINAFAAGVKLTNPRAKISLHWSCAEENPIAALLAEKVDVISNREASNAKNPHWALEWGTYMLDADGSYMPLAVPCWNWGPFYEKVCNMLLNGTWQSVDAGKALNYWWGLDSGVIDIQFNDALPAGVKYLGELLKRGLIDRSIDPFHTKLYDNCGILRNDGEKGFTAEDLMNMDWLCDNVIGSIPSFDELLPASRGLVRLLGVYRDQLPPEVKEVKE